MCEKKELIYLASPYNHPEEETRRERFMQAIDAAAYLMKQGRIVYSPIVHSHPIAYYRCLPTGFDYWRQFDEVMLRRCNRMIVLMIDGWYRSTGIIGEIEIAQSIPIPIQYASWCPRIPLHTELIITDTPEVNHA